MRSVATRSPGPLPVALPVRSATNSRPRAADLNAPCSGRPTLFDRRSGIFPGRRFCFEGP
jgi:hypothetical protein